MTDSALARHDQHDGKKNNIKRNVKRYEVDDMDDLGDMGDVDNVDNVDNVDEVDEVNEVDDVDDVDNVDNADDVKKYDVRRKSKVIRNCVTKQEFRI